MNEQRSANWNGTDDEDPFATGGHGRFMQDGAAPAVIGALPTDDVDETVRVQPGQVVGQRYDREPPTSPIPVQSPDPAKKGSFFGKLFGR